ncbi:hypothetical protein F0562_024853 [Nyssa sinensis]|uniref:Myb-like domain-containing protein n=1 Tax=Nyssa sinensis TaxID=561372 RepID=A0A5J5BE42_9ASTE|nr:hypothetical protein F0562_024853 [Nyssa sinensis]
MGEVVVENWSAEEEHLFHEVVFSNPASLKKNFWDHLSMAFPFRTIKEIVSYYFNVFMLRKRAEQNRCDPMNIDSDNDEWQWSDDSGDDEIGTMEEDEDSVIDSSIYHDDPGYDEVVAHATSDNYENVDLGGDKGITNLSDRCPRKLLANCNSDKILLDEGGDHDAQDESYKSSDRSIPQVTKVKANNSKPWLGSFHDFLPTCSMIEEVFGVGAWNCKARDGKSLS